MTKQSDAKTADGSRMIIKAKVCGVQHTLCQTVHQILFPYGANQRANCSQPPDPIPSFSSILVTIPTPLELGRHERIDTLGERNTKQTIRFHHGVGTSHPHRDTGGHRRVPRHQLQETGECGLEGEDQVQHDCGTGSRRRPTNRGVDRAKGRKGELEYLFSLMSLVRSLHSSRRSGTGRMAPGATALCSCQPPSPLPSPTEGS